MTLRCKNNKASLSIFFSMNQTDPDVKPSNNFFKFTSGDSNEKFDLTRLVNVGSVMHAFIMGYLGTDTMPSCEKQHCWYLYQLPFAIT